MANISAKRAKKRSAPVYPPFPQEDDALVREAQILKVFPICKTSWYEGIRSGKYPKPIKHGRSVFWRAGDIRRLIASISKGAV